ncbi:MAG: glycoside hydrolase family 99-like domain-containing protein [Planctomycetota bacterium]
MKATVKLVLPAIVFLFATFVVCDVVCAGDFDYQVGAYYYPWYGGDFHGGHTLREHLDPQQQPSLGWYDQHDAGVINQHYDWARYAGVNFFITSYWGQGHYTDDIIKNYMMPNPNRGDINLAVFLEPSINDSNIYSEMSYLSQNYLNQPGYYCIDGKPVVYVYLTRIKADLAGYVDNMRQAAQDNGIGDIYVVGDEVGGYADGVSAGRISVLDAVTAYDVYGYMGGSGNSPYVQESALDIWDDKNRSWKALADAAGVDFIPSVSPGYNDTAVPGRDNAPISRKLGSEDGEFGSLFQTQLEMVKDVTDNDIGRTITVVSWNEWHEDTQIEPTSGLAATTNLDNSLTGNDYTYSIYYKDYGTLYLDILRAETKVTEPITFEEHVEIQASFIASGDPFLFNGGFTVSNGGILDQYIYDLIIDNGQTGTIAASGGQVLAANEIIGQTSTGAFIQEGGYNTVLSDLILGDDNGSSGLFNLANGELNSEYVCVGHNGTGAFTQTGGTNTVESTLYLGYGSGSSGTYALGGGVLSAKYEYIGHNGTGAFTQTGGTNSIEELYVKSGDTYTISAGTLGIQENGFINGTVDFANGTGTLYIQSGIVDLQGAVFTNTGSATFAGEIDSLTLFSPGFNPATDFGTYNSQGITYTPGTTMIVYEGQSYTGHYDFDDPLEIRGTLIAAGGVFGFVNSLTISNGGTFNTGTEILTLNSGKTATIAASGGSLTAPEVLIGYGGESVFNQDGGTVAISGSLYLAYDVLFIKATYNLNNGALATADLIVGDGKGRGKFNQSGGTLSVSGTLNISSPTINNSVYHLDGGTVEAHDLVLGGKGILNITNNAAVVEISGSFTLQDNAIFLAVPGTTIHMTGSNFENTSTSLNNLGWMQNTTFIFEDSSDTDTFEIACYDYGLIEENFYGNFGLEGLILDGSYNGTLQLLDAHVNFTGLGPSTQSEALYVRTLVLGGNATLDLNGYNLYAMEYTNYGGEVLNGEIQAMSSAYIPEPGTLLLLAPALLGFAGILFKRRK